MYSICQLVNTILLRIEGIFTAFLVALSSVERAKTAVSVVLSRDKIGCSCQFEHFVT